MATDAEIEKEIRQGKEAQTLRTSGVYQELFQATKANLFREWCSTDPDRKDVLAEIHATVRALECYENVMDSVINNGKVAEEFKKWNRQTQ